MNTVQKDEKYLGRGGTPRPLVVKKTDGFYVYDDKGKRYIDFFMGWCVGEVGWNIPEIDKEIRKFKGPTYVAPSYYYEGWSQLAELLAKVTPKGLVKSFRATGGTEAVEIALQAAMSHTKRQKFISIEGSYHGHSIGAMSIGSSDFRSWYKNLLFHCNKITPPLNEQAAVKVEQLLSKRDIAAYISEPIVCNIGVEIPDKIYYGIVQKACKKYGTLFVADEVATGFGRTGKMFACEHYSLEPDIMCLAKGLSGGYGAIGATIMTEEVAKSFEFSFSFYSTFGWHPLNVQAAIANIKYLLKNKKKLLANADKSSRYIQKRLNSVKFRYPATIRAKGLAIGVEIKNERYVKGIILKALQKGLLLADTGPTKLVMFPALDIDLKTLKKGLDILEECL
ncbi:hypothetical protein A2615_00585 [Candidatus Curtissbacteria bacterium RIFOXYD1_FULL_41_36]|nr:MAG: hypothetical protein A2615_00585 [Candidatus Curtissbacteria bacterium RIFOXYD1_FULL_41_36]OGE11437.1 MAG: hypothetical protein A2470_04855 [Candidatus Curtissbacteria bacterium RIFOXYC2_FULL_41_11]OGE14822.1 MAG: hypothetical protein A3J89_00645 [Candidatus Curtissbacteria bacterium RIFOXYB12_FULL_40_6]OGE15164.1 MAG: hypothetical protein A2409_01520 [Candidatus Curtissbacteria bacterium RIFOXYC1_FULL_41_36]